MPEEISPEQLQQMLDAICKVSEDMGLDEEQILDAIGRSLLAVSSGLGKRSVKVNIDGFGSCDVKITGVQGVNEEG